MNDTAVQKEKQWSLLSISAIALLTIVLWHFIPFGRIALYPFIILGTWFHEMGHGMAALILGADFHHLQIFPNGSGVAYYSGDLFLGDIGRAIVAGAGPIAPSIIGFIFISVSKNWKKARMFIFIFSIILAVCAVIWVRSLFGLIAIIGFAVFFFISAIYGKPGLNKFLCQFIGIQAFMSLYLSIDYLFSSSGTTDAGTYYSDTFVMQQALFLPYWAWASIIIAISVLLIVLSFRRVMK